MIRWIDIPRRPPTRTLRQFGLLCLLLVGGAAAWRWWSGVGGIRTALLAAGAALGAVGVAWPPLIRPVFVGWLMLTFPIAWAVSRLILVLLFYGLFTPIGLLFRLTGRDALQLKRNPRRESYWASRPGASGDSYYRQY